MNAISKTGKGDSSGSQSVFAIPKWCNIGIAGICGGLPGGIIGRFQFVCYTCQKSDYYAEGHAVGMMNQRRESLKIPFHPGTFKTWSFSGPPKPPKVK